MRTHYALLLLIAIPFRGIPSRAQSPVSPAFAAALQAKLDSCVNNYNVPGISATLLLPGNRFWNGASGVANIYSQAQMDTAYLFQLASITKHFTAAVAMQLVEEGVIGLDETVGDYLPPLTYVPSNIRIRHLLRHTSGLADIVANPNAANSWLLNPNYNWDPVLALETFGSNPQTGQGAGFAYSNTNFIVLGMIIEEATGQPFHEVLNTRILAPLGLSRTAFRPDDALPGPLVPGWSSLSAPNSYTDDMTYFLGTSFSSMVYTAGAMVGTPWDVARFNRALFTGELVAENWLDTMRTCINVNMGGGATGYGYGTMRYSFGGRTYYGHGGDINGFTQLTIHTDADSVTLSIAINRNNAPRGPIAAALLGVAFQQLTVSVAEVDRSPSARIYPNPADEVLFIDLPDPGAFDQLEIIDALGKVHWQETIQRSRMESVSLAHLVPGSYIVRLTGAHGKQLERIIVH
ncbi:MAG: serine hydrolase [Flavobacteriales bacterium]|nr:serine hydrolase [Flavobacteriales bacterium]